MASDAIESVLRDGTPLLVRPIEPRDRDLLREGFRRLSATSRYQRFLSPTIDLTESQLSYLTEVDHSDHEALLAIDPSDGRGVGVARFVRLEAGGDVAEVAVTVADEWQGRGVGTSLLDLLVHRARNLGLARFRAFMLSQNTEMVDMLERLGEIEVLNREGGTLEVEIELPQGERGTPTGLARLLRAAAGG